MYQRAGRRSTSVEPPVQGRMMSPSLYIRTVLIDQSLNSPMQVKTISLHAISIIKKFVKTSERGLNAVRCHNGGSETH